MLGWACSLNDVFGVMVMMSHFIARLLLFPVLQNSSYSSKRLWDDKYDVKTSLIVAENSSFVNGNSMLFLAQNSRTKLHGKLEGNPSVMSLSVTNLPFSSRVTSLLLLVAQPNPGSEGVAGSISSADYNRLHSLDSLQLQDDSALTLIELVWRLVICKVESWHKTGKLEKDDIIRTHEHRATNRGPRVRSTDRLCTLCNSLSLSDFRTGNLYSCLLVICFLIGMYCWFQYLKRMLNGYLICSSP